MSIIDKNIKNLSRYRNELMGLSALWIFFYHMQKPLLRYFPFEGRISSVIHAIADMGFGGVDIFLLLSGIGMTYALEKESLIDFYRRRFRRVFPAFAIVATITAMVGEWTVIQWVKILSGYSFFMEDMYSFLWFPTAMLAFYLFSPIYYSIMKKVKYKFAFLAVSILIWYFASHQCIDFMRTDLFGMTNRIPIYLTGFYLGFRCQLPDSDQSFFKIGSLLWTLFCLVLIGIGIFAFKYTVYDEQFLLLPVSDSCVPMYTLGLGLSFLISDVLSIPALFKGSRFHLIVNRFYKILRFYGGISLEFYLFYKLFRNWLEGAWEDRYGHWDYNLLMLILITLAAFLLNNACTSHNVNASSTSNE